MVALCHHGGILSLLVTLGLMVVLGLMVILGLFCGTGPRIVVKPDFSPQKCKKPSNNLFWHGDPVPPSGPVPQWWQWTTMSKQVIGKFLTCLAWKFRFYCEPRPSTTMRPCATEKVQYHHGSTGPIAMTSLTAQTRHSAHDTRYWRV